MREVEDYTLGKSKVPPWAGDVMSNITYEKNTPIKADVSTSNGVKSAVRGDVLMRVGGKIILIREKDAKKYGIKGGK